MLQGFPPITHHLLFIAFLIGMALAIYRLKLNQQLEASMEMSEIKAMAKSMGVKTMADMDMTAMVRAIQMTEGNSACFRTMDPQQCGQMSCMWRDDCLKQGNS